MRQIWAWKLGTVMILLSSVSMSCGRTETLTAPTVPGARSTPIADQGSARSTSGTTVAGEGGESPEAVVRLLIAGLESNQRDRFLDAIEPEFRRLVMSQALMYPRIISLFLGSYEFAEPPYTFRDMKLAVQPPTGACSTVLVSGRVRWGQGERTLDGARLTTVQRNDRWFVADGCRSEATSTPERPPGVISSPTPPATK